MKRNYIILMVTILISFSYCGCTKSDQENKTEGKSDNSTSNKSYRLSASAQARFDDLKEDYIARVKATVENLNKKIETLQLKKEGAPDVLQKPIESSLKIVMEKKEILIEQLKKLENADEENFDIEKTAITKAISDVERAYEELKSQF